MTNDYWELLTTDDDVIKDLAIWAMGHTDLVDLVDIDVHWLQIRVIPDEIIPRFPEFLEFLESWKKSQGSIKVTGYYQGIKIYVLGFRGNTIEATFNDLSPVIIDLDTRRLSVWVIDGGTGKSTLVAGLSPINHSKMISNPEYFPRFVRIGYEYEKGIYNYT
jgi:hypothetical protein